MVIKTFSRRIFEFKIQYSKLVPLFWSGRKDLLGMILYVSKSKENVQYEVVENFKVAFILILFEIQFMPFTQSYST